MANQLVKTPDSRWGWLMVQVEQDDLVVRHTRATNFGHVLDTEDNGIGSNGFPVGKHPELPMVALPYRCQNPAQFENSPIPPGLPVKWPGVFDKEGRLIRPERPGIVVRVFSHMTGKTVDAELADLGPSLYVGPLWKRRYLHTGIDLSEGTVRALGHTLRQGEYLVDYRIIGGAKYLQPEMRP